MAVSESDGNIYLEKNESDALEYFSKCGYLNKHLLTEEKYFIKYMGDKWKDVAQSQKDALLDLLYYLYVDDNIRNFYLKNGFRYNSDNNTKSTDEDKVDVQKSFPRLFINSGQKINVDFENDLWTWRDEHSGPFSWMSRSQQDLTMTDFDEENIAKPQPRLPKIDVEAESQQRAQKQFSHIGDSWSADIIGDYKKKEPKIKLTPKISYPEKIKNKHFLEEINPAFNESCENLPNSSQPPLENNGRNGTTGKPLVVPSHNADIKDKPQLPKKSTNKGSFNKSLNGANGTDKLLHKENRDILVEKKGFSNAVMEPEWSTFVGAKNVPLPPEPMVMERSDVKLTDSPYQGDDVRLIQASPSSVQQATLLSPAHSEWSEESTPDHTTYLLKGMQSPQHHRKPHTLAEVSNNKKRDEEAAALDADEILKVEMKGDKIIVTTENQATNDQDADIDVPVTGFDFLDNW